MAGILPHSAAIAQDIREYLHDAVSLIEESAKYMHGSSEFKHIYRITLGANAVLRGLSHDEVPRLSTANAVIQRIPLHILLTQLAAAYVELRRLIELTFLAVFFSDHPVEWEHFARTAGQGISTAKETPIAYIAHREPSFYANYTKELLAAEPSGLATEAAARLSVIYGQLSGFVHIGAASTKDPPKAPIEEQPAKALAEFARQYKATSSDALLVLAASFRDAFDQLQPAYRGWFDWLQGPERAKKIRSGKFGLL